MGTMPWSPNSPRLILSSWTQNSQETSGGGVARDCKIHHGRREELTLRHRNDCWDGHVRRVLCPGSYPPPPSSSALSSASPTPCAREIYVTFPRIPLILVTPPSEQTENPSRQPRPLGFRTAAGKVLIRYVYKIRPRFSLLPQHFGSGSF